MNATVRYIEQGRAALGGGSYYILAKRLGIPRQCVSRYKSGERDLPPDVAVDLAAIIGIPPSEIILAVVADQSPKFRATMGQSG